VRQSGTHAGSSVARTSPVGLTITSRGVPAFDAAASALDERREVTLALCTHGTGVTSPGGWRRSRPGVAPRHWNRLALVVEHPLATRVPAVL
jgi:hypothetical protein